MKTGTRKFIVELEKNVWLAPREGDPGRTLVKEYAKEFASEKDANRAIESARVYRLFRKAKVIPLGSKDC
jgi:hypothetical protein